MSPLRFISSLAIGLLVTLSCGSFSVGRPAKVQYYICPEMPGRTLDTKMADYLAEHLQNRTPRVVLDDSGIEVMVHVGPDVDGDFAYKHDSQGYYLAAKDERTFIWLAYQFIKMAGKQDPEIGPTTFLRCCSAAGTRWLRSRSNTGTCTCPPTRTRT